MYDRKFYTLAASFSLIVGVVFWFITFCFVVGVSFGLTVRLIKFLVGL